MRRTLTAQVMTLWQAAGDAYSHSLAASSFAGMRKGRNDVPCMVGFRGKRVWYNIAAFKRR
jgi:hypothetical protein